MKMFVYGTLQPGEGLAGYLRDAWVGTPVRGTTPGTLHHVWGGDDERPVYPVAFVGSQEPPDGPVVHGTVLELDDTHPAVLRTIQMEQGAGYQVVPVVVKLVDGSTVDAMAFRFRRETVGPQIEHGDWLRVVHSDTCEHEEEASYLHWREDTYGEEYRIDCGCTCLTCAEY